MSMFTRPSESFAIINPEIDSKWATGIRSKTLQESYFDYFFTGQDVEVYIEGTEEWTGYKLPLINLAYSVEQKKVPLFGHASSTYDAVMRGNRMVTGAFTIATTTVDYMTELLSFAANTREELRNGDKQLAPIKEDLANIQRYWSINTDNALLPSGTKHLFSGHPPFNMYILVGFQPDSNAIIGSELDCEDVSNMYPVDKFIALDINERLMQTDPEGTNRRIIQNVELVKFDTMISSEGDVLAETYSFFARDEFPFSR